MLNFLSVFQVKDADNLIAIFAYTPTFTLISILRAFVFYGSDKIKKYLQNLEELFNKHPDAKPFIDKSYQRSKYIFFGTIGFAFFCVSSCAIVSLATRKLQSQFYLPEVLGEDPQVFHFVFVLQTFFYAYAAFLLISVQDLFFLLLVMIHGYFKFCEDQFREMNIKKCVDIHLDLKRFVKLE